MKILIIGSGARECALAKKLHAEKQSHEIFFAPGNGATLDLGTNIAFASLEDLRQKALALKPALSIVGSEQYLAAGVVDLFMEAGLKIFGANKKAARLEYSKSFAKDFARRYGIKTARFISTSDPREALEFAEKLNFCVVVKADGLCGGKGALVAKGAKQAKEAIDAMLIQKTFGAAGEKIVVEELLEGFELSVFALCDGKNHVLMPPCQDYKRAKDGDTGANTGGMGALCPVPVGEDLMRRIQTKIVEPTLNGMKKDGNPFSGVLYCGLMVRHGEPLLLEYNVRFGDPECQVLMPVLGSDLSALLMACVNGELGGFKVEFNPLCALCVVAASADYPCASGGANKILGAGASASGGEILSASAREILDGNASEILSAGQDLSVEANAGVGLGSGASGGEIFGAGANGGERKISAKKIDVLPLESKNAYLCFANVEKTAGGLYANSGRICSCVGLGNSLDLAAQRAYALVENVHFEGKQYRKDIGRQWIKTA
ncbi:MAG: phosphoribosylamine--glycine ligase [Helicobacteraceae bacterium]